MKLINGQPCINLDNYLDISEFDKLEDKIILSIAKNAKYIEPSYTPHFSFYNKKLIGYLEEKEQNKFKFKDLDEHGINWLTKLQGTATLGTQLVLRGNRGYPKTYNLKHTDAYSINLPACNDFQFLFEWIDNQNCFSEYGRTMFWINEPNQTTTMHTDYGNVSSDKRDMFIWITGRFPKSILLFDDITEEVFESNARSIIFNNTNWHSSKGHPCYSSWSLRIDGVFNKPWAAKVGIADYFRL